MGPRGQAVALGSTVFGGPANVAEGEPFYNHEAQPLASKADEIDKAGRAPNLTKPGHGMI